MRLFWQNERKLDLWIDEFHHLAGFQHSIVGEILREVRARGSVVAISQSMSDVLPGFLSQFGRIFCGADFDPRDLSMYPYHGLAESLYGMPKYRFVDVREFARTAGGRGDYHVSIC